MISRNAPCSCGSKKRYKYCCGSFHEKNHVRNPVSSKDSRNVSPVPKNLVKLMQAALAAQRRNDLETAEKLYSAALVIDGSNIDALHMTGVNFFYKRDLNKAEKFLKHAYALSDEPPVAMAHNMQILLQETRWRKVPSEPLELITHRELQNIAFASKIIFPREEIKLADLQFAPKEHSIKIDDMAVFPEILSYEIRDAMVDAESSIPATDHIAVIDQPDILTRILPVEVFHKDYHFLNEKSALRTKQITDPLFPFLPEAVVVTSRYWNNWAHFLTEILPKILIAERQESWREWPLLISAFGLNNARELTQLLLPHERKIIRAVGRVHIGRAGFISSTSFCPFEYRYEWEKELPRQKPYDCIFSMPALNLVRSQCHNLIRSRNVDGAGKRLFLRRESGVRRLVNSTEVEHFLEKRGFKTISPEKYSVSDQIALFLNAEIVVAPCGAALANMVFTPPGGRFIGILPLTKHNNYHYFSNMAQALEHYFIYCIADAVGVSEHPAHMDMRVDVSRLADALDALL